MSIFNQLTSNQIKTDFTHYAWLSFCPVYINLKDTEDVSVCERNWIPEWVLTLAEFCQNLSMTVISYMDAEYEPQYMFKVTGVIK